MLISGSLAFGQSSQGLMSNLSAQTGGLLLNSKTGEKTAINPNHYAEVEFAKGKVDGYTEAEYRYNAFTDNVEFLDADKNLLSLIKNDRKLRFNNGRVYQYLTFKTESDGVESRYLQYVSDSEQPNSLLKSLVVKEQVNENTNSYSKTELVKYKKIETFYLKNENGVVEIPTSAKKVKSLLGDKADEIVKSKKLNLKKQGDLLTLVDLLNK